MVVVNPFSEESRHYLNIDINKIDKSLIRLAIARSNENNNEKYMDLDDDKDIISLFLLLQSLSKTPYAPEVLVALNAFENLMRERITTHFSQEVIDEMKTLINIYDIDEHADRTHPLSKAIDFPSLGITVPREDLFRLKDKKRGEVNYMVLWSDVYDVTNITKQYIIGSYMFVTKWELIDLYSKTLKKRCKDYMKKTSIKMEEISHPVYEQISSMVRSLIKVRTTIEHAPGNLSEDLFPPCVKIALGGVSSGQRNYAITILLTSFLSYARLMPSTKIFDRDSSFTLSQNDVELLINDVVPTIIEAGNRCEPPLFKEHSLEKLNIFYHLGFGMTNHPNVTDYGKSKWYLPPSCSKISENAPQLCQPDEFCKEITWGIVDWEKVDGILKKVADKDKTALGEDVLKILFKSPKTLKELSEILGSDEKELSFVLGTLTKNKLVRKRKITNPIIYYIRKKRASNQKS
ncbi:MAG: hypothetical protein ACXQS3_03360 [Candidatus Methanofastidiosia archaeon]